jgi:hypothetical protein
MYAIPSFVDLEKFIGGNIQQICFSTNNIILYVENAGDIQFEGNFAYSDKNEKENEYRIYPCSDKLRMILNLVGTTITRVDTDDERRNLIIYTDKKQKLEILRDDHYEMMTLFFDGKQIIV